MATIEREAKPFKFLLHLHIRPADVFVDRQAAIGVVGIRCVESTYAG
jgi:hypothetical protein